jgi:hypothetical protein
VTDVSSSELIDELSRLNGQLPDSEKLRIDITNAVSLLRAFEENDGRLADSQSKRDEVLVNFTEIERELELLKFELQKREKFARSTGLVAASLGLAMGVVSAIVADAAVVFAPQFLFLLGERITPIFGVIASGVAVFSLFSKIRKENQELVLNRVAEKVHSYLGVN